MIIEILLSKIAEACIWPTRLTIVPEDPVASTNDRIIYAPPHDARLNKREARISSNLMQHLKFAFRAG